MLFKLVPLLLASVAIAAPTPDHFNERCTRHVSKRDLTVPLNITQKVCGWSENPTRLEGWCKEAGNCHMVARGTGPCAPEFVPHLVPNMTELEYRLNNNLAVDDGLPLNGLHKRQNVAFTGPTIGNKGRTFGSTNPCDQWHDSLYNLCGQYGCQPAQDTAYDNDSDFADNGYWVDSYIAITAGGNWPGWNYRNCLVDSIVNAASNGQTWWETSVQKYDGTGACNTPRYENVNLWQGYGTDYWNLAMFANGNNGPVMIGSMWGYANQAEYLETDNTLCADIIGAVTAGIGAVNSDAGGILGAIENAVCS